MENFFFQLVGLLLLCVGLGLGYWYWIKPHQATLTWSGRGLLILVILTLMGGFVGSPFWWLDEARSFSWDLPPLASRMLASAGWAFVVVSFLALQHPVYKRLRLILILLFVYLVPLAAAILLFHLDRFDFQAPITYAFFSIVIIMVFATSVYLFRQPVIILEEAQDKQPSGPQVRGWLTFVAVICGLWGLALFATDQGPIRLIWVWPGDLLSSRLIGVMLLTISAGAWYSRTYADPARLMLAMILTYGLGLSLASLWNIMAGKPVPLGYLLVFGLMAIVSAVLLRLSLLAKRE